MHIVVKILGLSDIDVLGHVAAEVFDKPIDPDLAKEFLADPRHHLAVAIEAGQVVAMATGVHYVHPDKRPQLFVNEVAVTPTHRGRGLGKAVLAALLEVGRRNACSEAWVLTDRGNRPANGLYRSLGGTDGAGGDPADVTIGYTFHFD